MKNILVGLTGVVLLLAGCRKKSDDLIQGKTADQRLSAELAAYQAKLMTSQYGWILVEYTTGSAINQGASTTGPAAVFAYYMQFTDSNTVSMFSDFDTVMAVTPKASSYRLKAVQRPALIFDTYSYIHVPCDPDPAISKSPFGPGLGWGADFEFSFADNIGAAQLGDTIHLIGNLNGTNAVMIKATQAQHDAYYGGGLANAFVFQKIQNYFKRVTSGGKTYEITPGISPKIIDINWLEGSTLHSVSTSYYLTGQSVNLVIPVNDGSQTISSIDDISYNPSTSVATAAVNGTHATIAGAIAPIKNDASAPQKWRSAAALAHTVYISPAAFHSNGVDDALGVENLVFDGLPYLTYVYYPGAISGLDLVSPFFASGANAEYPDYVTAAQMQNISGRAHFTLIPLDVTPDPVTQTNTLLSDPSGFYLILKEDGTSYDMVIASDAKSWMSWQFEE